MGISYIERGDIDRAVDEFDNALTLEPDNVEALVRLGTLHASGGRPEKAASYYRKAISLDPHCGTANYGLALLRDHTNLPVDISRMELVLSSADISESDKVLTGFALGRSYEGREQFNKAFAAMSAANRRQRVTISYSLEEQKSMFDRHTNALNQNFIDHCKPCCVADATPILVLGMPRSGTSLVEQILASHPLVHGAGEVEHSRVLAENVRKMTGKPFPHNIVTIAPQKLRELALEYVRKLKSHAKSKQRVVDKLPHNFLRIGLFAALLPNAKIILCERDPIDNCMSIYQHHFSNNHGYAADLRELGEYYNLYRDMISIWMKLLPNKIYRISYEELVAHPEEHIRALLEYCNLPFDAACLAFHETARFVSSPSAAQVRTPIHSRSIGRAKNYEKHLTPLVSALAQRLPANGPTCEDRN
ncbi:MAG: sulfotransferase [Proteobacteria bacterium]|nr:sulfotransferase [Pseudomonadota bacterium]